MYGLALEGFRGAVGRYQERRRTSQRAEDIALPAMEALFWGMALQDRLERDDPVYKGLNGPGPELMRGLRCARNRGTHKLPMTISYSPGRPGIVAPLVTSLGPSAVQWLPLDALPKPDAGFPAKPADEAAYRARFEGREVGGTFAEVLAWFETERRRSGTLLTGPGTQQS